ncbi:hypothetical protein PMW_98 [Pseudomonas phage phiPMW]|uniref:Uncharacterized protein n=1 Tax=Pseudomonas phage phiPMW TaxID=1815582 RepID=A0A1S5R1D4_9CAUD|nr:hypothetical protein FDG97_gp098 [Pseudomonas phage phiPMW]ANA49223.1 hypothetical protein PMW_98 [Pseudomonas phage phiPMW]
MSDTERNKGKLIPTGIDTEGFTEDCYSTYEENGFVVIDGEIYTVEWEVHRETVCYNFADVKINDDGSIDFHTLHYNDGAHWTEVIESRL